jgi:hypothetical protein
LRRWTKRHHHHRIAINEPAGFYQDDVARHQTRDDLQHRERKRALSVRASRTRTSRELLATQACRYYVDAMSNTIETNNQRDRGGRFVIGGKPGPGRPKGARSKFGEALIEDLRTLWAEQGPDVLRRVARDDPAALLKVIASLMPRDIVLTGNIDVGVDVSNVLNSFRTAVAALGNEPPARLPRPIKVIDHGRK